MCVEVQHSLEKNPDLQVSHCSFILLCFYYDEMDKMPNCHHFQEHNSVVLITHRDLYGLRFSLVLCSGMLFVF